MKKYNKYKDSRIEWIGEIPEHWENMKFKYIYQFSMGATILKTDLKDNGKIPVYSATESDAIFGYVDDTNVILEENDFVIPARGNSIGHIYLVKQKSTCTQTTIYAKNKKFDSSIPKFIFYYQKGLREHLFQFDRTAIPQITVDQVKNNILLIPPKPEQTTIANFLDCKTAEIDNLITKKEKLLKLYDEEKTAIINQGVTKGLPADGKDAKSCVSTKDSGVEWLGEIHEHWEVKRMRFLSDIKTGDKDTENREDSGKYPFYVRSQTVEHISTYSFDGEAILTAGDGVGVGKVFHYVNGKFDYHQRVYRISNFKSIYGKFLFYYMKQNFYKEVIRISAKSTVDSLRLPMLQNFPICFPERKEQTAIILHIETETARINSKITKTEKLIELLKEYKTALISEVVTGKIKVF